MEEYKELLEQTIRKCVSRLDIEITEQRIQSMLNRLLDLSSIKEAVDLLALTIDRLLKKQEQKEKYDACMEDIFKLAVSSYNNKEEMLAQLEENKAKNYTPGNISVVENHKLIRETLKVICDRLNRLGVDYYLIGALAAFITTRNTTI